MTSIPLPGPTPVHGTHALVLGVSRYPYADGPDATQFGEESGLENLTSAARSASEFAAWLLNDYHNPSAPLASLRVLFSPSDGEELNADIQDSLDGPCPATRTAVQQELVTFRDLCKDSDSVGIVYAAGHGVQLTKRGAIVLLEDFAADAQLNKLEGAIDLAGCHAGLNGDGFARRQFWFVDACRQLPAFARKFESMRGALALDQPNGQIESSPLFLASSTRESAFAEIGGTSLFSQALLQALRGAGACGPEDNQENSWIVPVSSLVKLLNPTVKQLAGRYGEEQRVDITGRVNEATIHEFEGEPDVRIELTLVPEKAADSVSTELLFDGTDPIEPKPTTWPIKRTVPPGLYIIRIEATEPYRSVSKPLSFRPIESKGEVEVL